MNDDRLTMLLRDADPYDAARPAELGGADLDLLDEIVGVPAADELAARKHRSLRHRLLSGVAVAATVTAVVGTVSLLASPDGTRSPGATPRPSSPGSSVVTPVKYAAAAVRVAEQNPRILVTAPGWKVRTVEGFSPTSGEMTFQLGPDKWQEAPVYGEGAGDLLGSSRTNAAPRFEVSWYPRDQYAVYRADRARESGLQQLPVLDRSSQMISYAAGDHAVILPPEGTVFLELRGRVGDEAEFKRFLAEDIEQVDVDAWLAAMPESVVTSGSADKAATAILGDIPLPPGFDSGSVARGVALDPYQFGAKVTGAVTCGWIAEWDQARRAGDDAAARRAADALGTSRQWKVLNEMNAEGDYPEAIWGYADQVQAGVFPEGYRSGLGC